MLVVGMVNHNPVEEAQEVAHRKVGLALHLDHRGTWAWGRAAPIG